jgi:hypothetical protein
MDVANRPPSIAPLEDPKVLDRLELAGGTIDLFWDASPGGAAVALIVRAGRYVQLAGSGVAAQSLFRPQSRHARAGLAPLSDASNQVDVRRSPDVRAGRGRSSGA